MTEVTSELRCHIRHLRAAKLCTGGARAWFAAHDMNWMAFLRDGIAAQVFLDTGDPLALRVVDAARAEVTSGE